MLAVFIYWRYSSRENSLTKGPAENAGEKVDSVVRGAKNKLDDAVESAKDKVKKAADTVEQAAADVKKKL